MFNVYIVGDEVLKNELIQKLGSSSNIQQIPDDTTNIVFELNSFPDNLKKENINYIDENCSRRIPVLTSSLCSAVSEQCSYSKFPDRLIGCGIYNSFSDAHILEIAPSKISNENIVSKAEDLFNEIKLNTIRVPDRPGLVFPRILTMIINEAAQVYSEQIATREDIDTAMKLGTNYPYGPLEWADILGIDLVYNVLSNLQRYFGENRYRPHPQLKEMVDLNMLGKKTGKGFYRY